MDNCGRSSSSSSSSSRGDGQKVVEPRGGDGRHATNHSDSTVPQKGSEKSSDEGDEEALFASTVPNLSLHPRPISPLSNSVAPVFVIANQGSGLALTASNASDHLSPCRMSQLKVGDALAMQLWQLLDSGKIVSVSGQKLIRVPASSQRRVGVYVVGFNPNDEPTTATENDERRSDQEQWRIGSDGIIKSHVVDGGVLDVKGFVTSETAPAMLYPLRHLNVASQRWFVVPRSPPKHIPRICRSLSIAQTFMIVNTASEMALDTMSDGRVAVFAMDSSAQSQRWQFHSISAGLLVRHCQTDCLLTLCPDGKIRVMPPSALSTTVDSQCWQFDMKGFIISRLNGQALELPTFMDGVQVEVAPRKSNVAGLGLLFNKYSSDSQVFRVVPMLFSPRVVTPNLPANPAGNVSENAKEDQPSNLVDDAFDLGLRALDRVGRDMTDSPHGAQLDQALDALDQLSARISSSYTSDDERPMTVPPAVPALRVGKKCTEADALLNPALEKITTYIFDSTSKDSRGNISGKDIKAILEASSLDQRTLLSIWAQVDALNLGKITRHQLCIVLGLIAQAQSGVLPNVFEIDLGTIPAPKIEGVDLAFEEVWM